MPETLTRNAAIDELTIARLKPADHSTRLRPVTVKDRDRAIPRASGNVRREAEIRPFRQGLERSVEVGVPHRVPTVNRGKGTIAGIVEWTASYQSARSLRLWLARLHLHLLIAGIPVLGISADVFGWVTLKTVGIIILLPLCFITAAVVAVRRERSEKVVLAAFLWGIVACAGYDAFRLPTIYLGGWWADFFGKVGGWATGENSNFLVGYLWRYVGDGGGIAVPFFILAATFGAARWRIRHLYVFAIGYAVFPVWCGLIVTDLLAPHGRELFPSTIATLLLSLTGHLVYGAILGTGYLCSRSVEVDWPCRLTVRLQPHPVPLDTPTPLRPIPIRGRAVASGYVEEDSLAA